MVRVFRRFGRPRQFESFEQLWLCAHEIPPDVSWMLNQKPLGRPDECDRIQAWNITDRVQDRNVVTMDLDASQDFIEDDSEVFLEVRCKAFLADLRIEPRVGHEGSMHIAGVVRGDADQPLDLYFLLDGKPCVERAILPGDAFQFPIPEGSHQSHAVRVRVDLVCGAVIWDVKELDCPMTDRSPPA